MAQPRRSRDHETQEYPDNLDARLLKIAGVCALPAMMVILDATVVSVAQRTFIREFSSTQAVVGWTMTSYTLALAAVIPLAGWAADRFGTKRLFLSSVLFFSLGSLLCAKAPSITLLMSFRAIQGLGGGMLMPLNLMIMGHEAGPQRIGRVMALQTIPAMLAPISGPIVGGWLVDTFGWQWIFLINLPIGLFTLVLAAVIFTADKPSPGQAFDFVGMLLLSPGLATFLYGVSSMPRRGTATDPHVYIPVAFGVLLVGAFVFHTLSQAHDPLIDLRLFRNTVATLANATLFLYGIAFAGVVLILPSYFQQSLGETPTQSGLHLIPQTLGAISTIAIAGQIMHRWNPGKVVLVGITLVTTGVGTFAYGVSQHYPYLPVLFIALMVLGMGAGWTSTPVTATAMQALKPREIACGSTLIYVNQQVAASIGTALISAILTSQLNRNSGIDAASRAGTLGEEAAYRGAYAVVFVVAMGLMAATVTPALFLPKRSRHGRADDASGTAKSLLGVDCRRHLTGTQCCVHEPHAQSVELVTDTVQLRPSTDGTS